MVVVVGVAAVMLFGAAVMLFRLLFFIFIFQLMEGIRPFLFRGDVAS